MVTMNYTDYRDLQDSIFILSLNNKYNELVQDIKRILIEYNSSVSHRGRTPEIKRIFIKLNDIRRGM